MYSPSRTAGVSGARARPDDVAARRHSAPSYNNVLRQLTNTHRLSRRSTHHQIGSIQCTHQVDRSIPRLDVAVDVEGRCVRSLTGYDLGLPAVDAAYDFVGNNRPVGFRLLPRTEGPCGITRGSGCAHQVDRCWLALRCRCRTNFWRGRRCYLGHRCHRRHWDDRRRSRHGRGWHQGGHRCWRWDRRRCRQRCIRRNLRCRHDLP